MQLCIGSHEHSQRWRARSGRSPSPARSGPSCGRRAPCRARCRCPRVACSGSPASRRAPALPLSPALPLPPALPAGPRHRPRSFARPLWRAVPGPAPCRPAGAQRTWSRPSWRVPSWRATSRQVALRAARPRPVRPRPVRPRPVRPRIGLARTHRRSSVPPSRKVDGRRHRILRRPGARQNLRTSPILRGWRTSPILRGWRTRPNLRPSPNLRTSRVRRCWRTRRPTASSRSVHRAFPHRQVRSRLSRRPRAHDGPRHPLRARVLWSRPRGRRRSSCRPRPGSRSATRRRGDSAPLAWRPPARRRRCRPGGGSHGTSAPRGCRRPRRRPLRPVLPLVR